jgi:hypothetical protein
METRIDSEDEREIRRIYLAALLRVEAAAAAAAAELGLAQLARGIRAEGRVLEATLRAEFPDEDMEDPFPEPPEPP